MLDQYRLRLKDGTILAVDYDGLRTWLLEEKVMVQPPGSRRWAPLKQVLAQGRPAALIPRPAAVPVAAPAVREPATPPRAAKADDDIPIPLKPIEEDEIGRNTSVTALADATQAPAAKRDDGIPIIPLKPLDEDDAGWSAAVTTPAHATPPPAARPDDGITTIPLKPLDEDERPRRAEPEGQSLLDVAAAEVARHSVSDRPWQWTAPDPRSMPLATEPEAHMGTAAHDEGEGALLELEPIEEREAPQIPPQVDAVLRAASGWIDRFTRSLPRRSELPALPRPSRQRGLALAGAVAVTLLVASTRSIWIPALFGPSRSANQATPVPPTLPAPPEGPPVPPDVQAAIDRLPHLAPDTIQLVISSSRFSAPDPPEVFRLAYAAANRGASALTPEEAQELRALRASVIGALRPLDRERVRAYDRVSAGRDLLVSEDARVLGLFARGVRALPPPRRERLQALLGKAIAAVIKEPPRATPLPR